MIVTTNINQILLWPTESLAALGWNEYGIGKIRKSSSEIGNPTFAKLHQRRRYFSFELEIEVEKIRKHVVNQLYLYQYKVYLS